MYASIVVPTYNRKKVLEKCIIALLDQSIGKEKYEIIVVDDYSLDDTPSYLDEMTKMSDNLHYIRHDKNQGAAVTRNDGIKAAQGDIVIMLDDDNVADYRFVESHLRYYEVNDGERIAVMGNAYFAPEVIKGSNFARYRQSRYLGCRPASERTGLDYSDLPPRYFGTLNCSARRADLIDIGMFDPTFGCRYAGEDEELAYRLVKSGVRIIFGEEARSLHYDEISIFRYKLKTIEMASHPYKTILGKHPDYFEDSPVGFLLPVNWETDSWRRIIHKLSLKLLLNPLSIYLAEVWGRFSDGFPALYFQPLYTGLIAGWMLRGLRAVRHKRLVTYGDRHLCPVKRKDLDDPEMADRG
jgi:glycosyltransferase involved in cell wall biosynthesis